MNFYKIKLLMSVLCFSLVFILNTSTSHAKFSLKDNADLKDKWQISVDAIVQPVVESGWIAGAVVGIITPNGVVTYAYGKTKLKGKHIPDSNTVYGLGSISQVFTAVVLSELSFHKKLKLNDPVKKYLPDNVLVSDYKNKPITVLNLATHSSGLPYLPDNFNIKKSKVPYQLYNKKLLYEFLNNYSLKIKPGTKYLYSPVGYGLLGHVLSLLTDKDYEDMINQFITKPLGMTSTFAKPQKRQKKQMSEAYNWDLIKSKPVKFKVLKGACALHSSVDDMLKFLSATLGFVKTPLKKSIQLTYQPKIKTSGRDYMGLGWFIRYAGGQRVVWRNSGASQGFSSWVGFIKNKKLGVVVLSNTATFKSGLVDKMGFNILKTLQNKSYKPFDLPSERHIKMSLKDFTGEYRYYSGVMVTVKPFGRRLKIKFDDGLETILYPYAKNKFFSKYLNMIVEFKKDDLGDVSKYISEINGKEKIAKKIQ